MFLTCIQDDFDEAIHEEQVYFTIKRLKVNKAPKIDGLIPEIFKLFNGQHIPLLTDIFNKIYSSGTFPKAWHLGSIKPIHKKCDVNSPGNYRGNYPTPHHGQDINIDPQ